MRKSDSIDLLATALSAAQAEITGAIKESENPFFDSTYADLASVWDAIRGPLSKNGLCVVQSLDMFDSRAVLSTLLAHKSGQWIESVIELAPSKRDAQGWGSVITYMRRYSLAAIVGVAQIDDDGNAASEQPKYAAQRQSVAKKQQAPKPQPKPKTNGNGPQVSERTSPNTPTEKGTPSPLPVAQPTFTKRSGGYNDFVPTEGLYKGTRLGDVPMGVLIEYKSKLIRYLDEEKKNGRTPGQAAQDVLSAIIGIEEQSKSAKEFLEGDKK